MTCFHEIPIASCTRSQLLNLCFKGSQYQSRYILWHICANVQTELRQRIEFLPPKKHILAYYETQKLQLTFVLLTCLPVPAIWVSPSLFLYVLLSFRLYLLIAPSAFLFFLPVVLIVIVVSWKHEDAEKEGHRCVSSCGLLVVPLFFCVFLRQGKTKHRSI